MMTQAETVDSTKASAREHEARVVRRGGPAELRRLQLWPRSHQTHRDTGEGTEMNTPTCTHTTSTSYAL